MWTHIPWMRRYLWDASRCSAMRRWRWLSLPEYWPRDGWFMAWRFVIKVSISGKHTFHYASLCWEVLTCIWIAVLFCKVAHSLLEGEHSLLMLCFEGPQNGQLFTARSRRSDFHTCFESLMHVPKTHWHQRLEVPGKRPLLPDSEACKREQNKTYQIKLQCILHTFSNISK